MLKNKFLVAIVIVVSALSVLVYTASVESAKAVVTVKELIADGSERDSIRLGAQVANDNIDYQTDPEFKLQFKVMDIDGSEETIPVLYHGIMPDTLKVGRHVILEGDYHSGTFTANSLLTQCPSKYEPPQPGESAEY